MHFGWRRGVIKVCPRVTRRVATTLPIAGKVLSISRSFALNCLHFIDKHEQAEGIKRFIYVALSGRCTPDDMCTCMRKTGLSFRFISSDNHIENESVHWYSCLKS